MAAVIINKETDSLKNLMSYDISSDSDDSSDSNKNDVEAGEDSSSSSSSSSSDGEDDLKPISTSVNAKGPAKKNKLNIDSTAALFGELELHDLPLPDLNNLSINYDTEEFIHMGNVLAIINSLVTVEALPGIPAYDLDTILFIEHQTTKKPLGAIFDVFGPVVGPIYCIRFKNKEDIEENGIKKDMKVYSAPKSEITRYVFVKELLKNKGTDASWLGDNEPPSDVERSSSEDEEPENPPRITKHKRGSLERHQHFERNMNRFNSFNTRVHNNMAESHCRIGGFPPQPAPVPAPAPFFNPSIPPPGFADNMRFNFHPPAPPLNGFFSRSSGDYPNRNPRAGPSNYWRGYP